MGALSTRLTAVAALIGSLVSVDAVAKREEPLTAVADLRYGSALYQYYLDDYMSALTELLVAKERRAILGHGDNPEIMEGGLAMGYGMERYASDIFERLLEGNRSVEVRDAAWLYLAKLRYAKQDYPRALGALDNISEEPETIVAEDANALRINVLIHENRIEDAATLLERSQLSERWLPYFYFNLGSAFARNGQYARAVGYFEYLTREAYEKEEFRALYDKAMTASGYAYLFQEQYEQSRKQFSRVRLTSALSNRALLGYGWASAQMGEYEEALKPWLHLSQSKLVDENNQEALLAVPYAYEKMGHEGQALRAYQSAEASFSEELRKIDEVLFALNDEELLAALKIEAEGQLDWMSFAAEKELSPQLTYLIGLFTQDEFHGSVQDLKDLIALRRLLRDWQDRLTFYGAMLDNREGSREEYRAYLESSNIKARIADMRAERAELAERIERIGADKNYFALATGEEADLIERVLRGQRNIDALRESDPFIDEYEESLRRYRGILLWQTSEEFGDRLWQSIKTLNQLDGAIAEVAEVEARVDALMNEAPDLGPWRQQMDDANAELSTLLARIEAAINRNERDLKTRVISILQGQRIRLGNYQAQARLSVARLLDKTLQAHEDAEFEKLKTQSQTPALPNDAAEPADNPTPDSPNPADSPEAESGSDASPEVLP